MKRKNVLLANFFVVLLLTVFSPNIANAQEEYDPTSDSDEVAIYDHLILNDAETYAEEAVVSTEADPLTEYEIISDEENADASSESTPLTEYEIVNNEEYTVTRTESTPLSEYESVNNEIDTLTDVEIETEHIDDLLQNDSTLITTAPNVETDTLVEVVQASVKYITYQYSSKTVPPTTLDYRDSTHAGILSRQYISFSDGWYHSQYSGAIYPI